MNPTTQGFVELTLEARDLESLTRFYTGAFGMEILSREEDRIWLKAGKHARLGLWKPGEKEFGDRGGRHVHFALNAAPGQLDGIVERLRAGGEDVEGPVEHEGGDRSIYIEDPEGNVVEVWDFLERGKGSEQGVAALA